MLSTCEPTRERARPDPSAKRRTVASQFSQSGCNTMCTLHSVRIDPAQSAMSAFIFRLIPSIMMLYTQGQIAH